MTLSQLRDEIAPTLRAACEREGILEPRRRSLLDRITGRTPQAIPWTTVLRIALFVINLLARRVKEGKPTVTPLVSATPSEFDPVLVAALAEYAE